MIELDTIPECCFDCKWRDGFTCMLNFDHVSSDTKEKYIEEFPKYAELIDGCLCPEKKED